jgi:hypothetical protein
MLDTSMYDDDDASAFIPCYNQIKRSGASAKEGSASAPPYPDIAALRAEQQAFVFKIIDEWKEKIDITNVILIGHHPISGYKHKDEKTRVIISFPEFIKLLYSVNERFAHKPINYYYLCADLHLYQIGNIIITPQQAHNDDADEADDTEMAKKLPMHIKQYIVGTGGTKLDPSPFLTDTPLPEDKTCALTDAYKATYHMGEEEIKLSTTEKHGFLEGELYEGKMHFKFIATTGEKFIEEDNMIWRGSQTRKKSPSNATRRFRSVRSNSSGSTKSARSGTMTRKRHSL